MAIFKMKLLSIITIFCLSMIVSIESRNHHKCIDRAIEAREEEANIVFTGTVKDLYPDWQHPGQRKAKVEVKRIMKGNTIIKTLPGMTNGDRWRPKLVMVDGIGDPSICESFARKYDTRIFMLNKNGNGELKLNSSLVRLTLNNIKEADAAVKDVPFVPKPTPSRAACEATFCAYGAQCVENADGKAMCECLEVCDDTEDQVCGSDRETYQSECHLRLKSCKEQKRILLIARHGCDVKDPCEGVECSFGAQCRPSLGGIGHRCECVQVCHSFGDSVGSKPICGSDGKDYPNVCEMQKTACEKMEEITVKYEGKCDPCQNYPCPEGKLCQLDEHRIPVCSCNTVCTQDLNQVCGTDGRTYSNPCVMRVEACKTHKNIQILFHGDCNSDKNPCRRVQCSLYEDCQIDRNGEAVCKCPDNCEAVMRPVCGSDGRTYDNECALKREACRNKLSVSIKFNGACSTEGPCSDYQCHHGAMCVVKNGRPMCECPNCSEEFKPVCGTDGKTYPSECKLRVENCEERRNVQVKYEGPCNGCQNKKCDFYATCETDDNGVGQCVCPEVCVQLYQPVCGTDGVTYPNECRMKVSSCRRKQLIVVASQGDCDLCKDVKCHNGAYCDNGRCVCPQRCPDNNNPVCATDGQTYTNECEMKRHSCIREVELQVFHMGECDEQQSGSGVDGSGVETCDEITCKFGGMCVFDVGCVCNFVCTNVRDEVCGSDGKTYGSKCEMNIQACKLQMEITAVSMDSCEFESALCDGNPPLNNPLTNRPYDCENGRDTCPSNSYCHRVNDVSRCCQEDYIEQNCGETRYGCCPDGQTVAAGPGNAGCPSYCQCNPLGSYDTKCDAKTRQCYCKPGIGGLRCDRCEPGYWGMPRNVEDKGCSPCECNSRGSDREDCEQMSGRCQCQPGIQGMKCDQCPNGAHIDTGDCVRSSIIGEFCSSDIDCVTDASYCKEGICACKDNRQPSADNTVCEESVDPCDSAPCLYGGVCEKDSGNSMGFECFCPLGKGGQTCQLEAMTYTMPSFAGKSFLQLNRFTNGHTKLNIEMVFESSNYNGILMYAGQMEDGRGDYVSLTLRDGFVEFRFDNGGGPAIIRSLEQITRNKIHRVIARRTSKEGVLRLDDGLEAMGTSPGSLASLNLGTDVFLGYVPSFTDEIKKNIGTDIGLVGCIESLTLEGTDTRKEYNLIYPSSGDIVSGMGISECAEGRPCSEEMPCLNGGSCMVIDGDSYECKCMDGYSGPLCEFSNGNTIDGSISGACSPNPCYNNGICRTLANGDYFCSCMDGYGGHRCDIDKELGVPVPEFVGDSYLELPIRDSVREDLIYEVWFLSKKPNGVLLYSEKKNSNGAVSDFFSLNLVNQYLQFRFDLGTGPSNITSKTKVPLNVYHKVQISRTRKSGQMILNDEEMVEGVSQGDTMRLDLPPVVYLGGFSGEYHRESGCNTGLQGQVQRVYENGIQIEDLLKDALKRHNVWRYQGPPCSRDYCMNGGTCVPILNQATCKCEDGFVGNKCEKMDMKKREKSTLEGLLDIDEEASEVNIDMPIKFDGDTHHKYLNRVTKKEKGQDMNQFEIKFKTNAASGLLLLQHKSIDVAGDYIALALRDGRVEASYNLGKEDKAKLLFLKSDVTVNDGQWHTVSFEREKRKAEIQVDNKASVSTVSTSGATQLDTDGNLWLGGARHDLIGLPDEYTQGFDGCISSLIINGEPIDFVQDRENHGRIQFCMES